MTRRSSKKPHRSQRNALQLPAELKSEERAIREFLSTAGKPPVFEDGCNFQITTLHPAVAQEMWKRELKAIRKSRELRAQQR